MSPIFITGTGTSVGKTIASVIVANALGADYWKPIQAGVKERTDSESVKTLLKNSACKVHPETYKLQLAASPHIAARQEGVRIEIEKIIREKPATSGHLVIEGAGGLLVPLNDDEYVIDLIRKMKAKVILVSRNYLGSINHSLLTAEVSRQQGLNVLGWIFNDEYMDYQDEIARWSGYAILGKIPKLENITPEILYHQSNLMKKGLLSKLENVDS